MSRKLTRQQFDLALSWLRRQDPPLVLPFGATPGEYPGGERHTFTEDAWLLYRWNPPGFIAYPDDAWDENASPMPTWSMLLQAVGPAELAQAQHAAIAEIHELCQRKITVAYGATNLTDEMLLRLRDGETANQNTERDRLRGLFRARRDAINAAATAAAVKRLLTAARRDSFWAPPAAD